MKNLMTDIVRVANELDQSGFSKEASVLDGILEKVAANKVDQTIPYGQMLNIPKPMNKNVPSGSSKAIGTPMQMKDTQNFIGSITELNNKITQLRAYRQQLTAQLQQAHQQGNTALVQKIQEQGKQNAAQINEVEKQIDQSSKA